jgi:hypothetical protein
MVVEARGVELRDDEDPIEAGVEAVRDRHVDQAILPSERHGWLGAIPCKWKESCAGTPAEYDGQYPIQPIHVSMPWGSGEGVWT